MQTITSWLAVPMIRAAAIVLASLVVAFIAERLLHRGLVLLTSRTKTDVDDKIIALLRRPILLTSLLLSLHWASKALGKEIPDTTRPIIYGVIFSLLIAIWTVAFTRSGSLVLRALSERQREGSLLQPSSLPLFEMAFKIALIAGSVYFLFVVWRVDLTAWLASAGILGIAIGFGAKDTLANLFAGIFIIADAPYKVGDFVVLDDSLRGRVTGIGIRSTRIITLDGFEVTVPNGIIGNGRIINETGGPDVRQRLRLAVSIAYGSDVDAARAVLLRSTEGVEDVCAEPGARVQFGGFGASGLDFTVLFWIVEPELRDTVRDRVNTRIYQALAEAKIEIPYDKLDVYVKETVGQRSAA